MEYGEFEAKFLEIKARGFVPSDKPFHKGNAGAVGNTLETQLGIRENNVKGPDYMGWELKSQRSRSGSPLTLTSIKPTFPAKAGNYIRQKWGQPDKKFPNVHTFRSSLFANRDSVTYGTHTMRLFLNRDEKRLVISRKGLDGSSVDESVYWSFDDLRLGLRKLNNLIYVEAEEKIIDGVVHFRFVSCDAFISFEFESFLNELSRGGVQYDNRLGVYGSGSKIGTPHDHGGAFRLRKPLETLSSLYQNSHHLY